MAYMIDEVRAILTKEAGSTKISEDDFDGPVFDALYEYFLRTGEMPYGTAKARTGDPYEWIWSRLEDMGLVK